MNSNMINPANYFNPFAKYNTVNKTSRGVYIPKDTESLLKIQGTPEKSASIFSDNYDPETDVMAGLQADSMHSPIDWLNKFFNSKDKDK